MGSFLHLRMELLFFHKQTLCTCAWSYWFLTQHMLGQQTHDALIRVINPGTHGNNIEEKVWTKALRVNFLGMNCYMKKLDPLSLMHNERNQES